jgi:cytochrome c-type biogenesis protein CcmE
MRPIRARVIHFLFFALRYLAITIVIVLFILHKNANAFVVMGGLLTMQFSIFLSGLLEHLVIRKEG